MIFKPDSTSKSAHDHASRPSEALVAAAVEAAYILDAVRR